MEAITQNEHDHWMDKITKALRSMRAAGQRHTEQMQTHGQPSRSEDRRDGSDSQG